MRLGILPGHNIGLFNLLSIISGLNRINPVCRKAERTVVFLNVCLRIDVSAARNSSLLKSEYPVCMAASESIASAFNTCRVERQQHRVAEECKLYAKGGKRE